MASAQINFDTMYKIFDKMEEMKKYKPPTPGYFPTLPEVNTMVESDIPYIVEYLIWLDSNLTMEQRVEHKPALDRLKEVVAEIEDVNNADNTKEPNNE